MSKSCLNQLYKSLVLPVLDYSSVVWDPQDPSGSAGGSSIFRCQDSQPQVECRFRSAEIISALAITFYPSAGAKAVSATA